jgi:hypothetical protein
MTPRRHATTPVTIPALLALTFAAAVAPVQAQSSTADKLEALKSTARGTASIDPNALGDFSRDLVYTAVTPCRIVDTRVAGGAFGSGVTRTFDVDGATFAAQGGVNASCNVPLGVAAATALTITVTDPTGPGYITAWGLGAQPLSSVINYVAGQTVANTTIVPVVPGGGNDFSIFASAGTHVVIDVAGYFSAPVATALDCTSVASASTVVPPNVYTAVDAICPSGRTATGGGTFPVEGTLGRPNIWTDGSPTVANGWRTWVDNQTGANRSVQTYAVCCRVPGR